MAANEFRSERRRDFAVDERGAPTAVYTEVRWATNSSGAEKNGERLVSIEWLVSIEMSRWQGSAEG